MRHSAEGHTPASEALAVDIVRQPGFHGQQWEQIHPAVRAFLGERLRGLFAGEEATVIDEKVGLAAALFAEAQVLVGKHRFEQDMTDRVGLPEIFHTLDGSLPPAEQLAILDEELPTAS